MINPTAGTAGTARNAARTPSLYDLAVGPVPNPSRKPAGSSSTRHAGTAGNHTARRNAAGAYRGAYR